MLHLSSAPLNTEKCFVIDIHPNWITASKLLMLAVELKENSRASTFHVIESL